MTVEHDIGEPNLTELLEQVMRTSGDDLRVCIPGIVTRADMINMTVDVQPAIRINDSISDPIIPNVPLWFSSSSSASITFPVNQNDDVLLIFCDRCLDNWISGRGRTTYITNDDRSHDITDAIAIPGKLGKIPWNRINDLSIKLGNAELLITGTGKVALGTSAVEVLNIISTTLQVLINGGGAPFVNVANGIILPAHTSVFTALKLAIDALKASI